MDSIDKSNRKDKEISWAIILQSCLLITNYAVKEVLQINNPSTRSLISLLFMIITGILYIKNFKIVLKRNGRFFILSYIFFFCLLLGSALLNPETVEFLPNISFWLLIICLPTAQYFLAIRNKDIFLNMLILSGYFQMCLGLVIFASNIFTKTKYDMVFSYLILTPIIILSYKIAFIKFKFIDAILLIIALVAIVTSGSRGPLLAYLIFLTLLIFNYLRNNKGKVKVFVFSVLSTFFIVVTIMNFQIIISKFNIFLLNIGIQSRTLYLLLNKNIDFSTGRSEIFKITISNINLKPIMGHGLAGDRVFLDGLYPHNIFLEIISQFGILLGGFFSLILILITFYGLFASKNKTKQHLTVIYVGLGLISLFYSGSYLVESNFWLFLAITISSFHFKKEDLVNYDKKEAPTRILEAPCLINK